MILVLSAREKDIKGNNDTTIKKISTVQIKNIQSSPPPLPSSVKKIYKKDKHTHPSPPAPQKHDNCPQI